MAVLTLASGQAAGVSAQQWATSGNNISNTNTGNVGVGTNSPLTTVSVVGSVQLEADLSGSTTGLNDRFFVWKNPTYLGYQYGLDLGYNAGTGRYSTRLFAPDTADFAFAFSSASSEPTQQSHYTPRMVIRGDTGNVGVGTAEPVAQLHVATPAAGYGPLVRLEGTADPGSGATRISVQNPRSYTGLSAYGSGSPGVLANAAGLFADVPSSALVIGSGSNIPIHVFANGSWNAPHLTLDTGGNVGVGTTTPTSKLTVYDAGNTAAGQRIGIGYNPSYNYTVGRNPNTGYLEFIGTNVTSSQYVGYAFNGGLSVTGNVTVDGNITAKYQDVAEWVPSTQKLAAGTVVVLDASRTNHVVASAEAYDTAVAGVVSAEPGIILGEGGDGKVKVATTGRARVRVDATRAAIKVGDLLVTSGVAGVAMKSVPVSVGGVAVHRPGTIVGKALEPLDKGVGEILVLLSLQ